VAGPGIDLACAARAHDVEAATLVGPTGNGKINSRRGHGRPLRRSPGRVVSACRLRGKPRSCERVASIPAIEL